MPVSLKSSWYTTLALSSVASVAQKLVEGAAAGTTSDTGLAAAATIGAVSSFLSNWANSQREAQHNESERLALATRNHHLRRGMAAALHRALNQVAKEPGLPAGLYDALMSNCEALLKQAETEDDALNQLLPVTSTEPQWEATNTYSPNLDKDAHALADLLQNWLTLNNNLSQLWSDDQVLALARQVLPFYRQAFAEDLAGNSEGPRMRAFTVKALQQALEGHAKTHGMLQVLLDRAEPRPIDLGQVRSWSLPCEPTIS
jgi:hypothetical protein